MGDLRTVLHDAVPSLPTPDVAALWAEGRRDRRRRRLVLTVAPVVVSVIGLAGALAGIGSDSSEPAADVTAGPTAGREQDVASAPIESLTVEGGLEVDVAPGEGISVEADDAEVLADIEVLVDGTAAVVRRRARANRDWERDRARVQVGIGELRRLDASNGVALELDVDQDVDLEVSLANGVSARGSVRVRSLTLELTNGVNVTLDGKATELDLAGDNGVRASLGDLVIGRLRIDLSMGATATVRVDDEIVAATLRDGARVGYIGDPRIGVTRVDIGSRLAQVSSGR